MTNFCRTDHIYAYDGVGRRNEDFIFDWHKLGSSSDLVHVMVQACIGKIIWSRIIEIESKIKKGDHQHLLLDKLRIRCLLVYSNWR